MSIIGQDYILDMVDKWFEDSTTPRFIILSGGRGCGKTTIAKYVAQKIGAMAEVGTKVDDVREMIATAYKVQDPTAYLIKNAEKMSASAENSLLKVTEEPPRQAYIILTVEDTSKLLATIRSRGTVLKVEPYNKDEIEKYARNLPKAFTEVEIDIIRELCTTPGQVNEIIDLNLIEFWNYVKLVLDNIPTASGVNCFKIALKMKFKEDGEGWDPIFFMRSIIAYALQKARESNDCRLYSHTIACSSKYIAEMQINGINKLATFDHYILEMRQIWREE